MKGDGKSFHAVQGDKKISLQEVKTQPDKVNLHQVAITNIFTANI